MSSLFFVFFDAGAASSDLEGETRPRDQIWEMGKGTGDEGGGKGYIYVIMVKFDMYNIIHTRLRGVLKYMRHMRFGYFWLCEIPARWLLTLQVG